MKRLLFLAALSMLALLILAPAALAQSDSLESQGITQPCPFQLDRFPEGTVCGEGGAYIDPETQTAAEPLPRPGSLESLGITEPCPVQLDRFPEGTVCGEGGSYIDPDDGRGAPPLPENGGTPSGEGGTYLCTDFDDQGQAQEAFGRSLRGDPEFPLDPASVDPDGDGIACEELPTATDPLDDNLENEAGEDGTITCEDFEDQGQAQEALGRVLRGDPAADADVLDDDGDGIACEELPTAIDENEDAGGETTGGETTGPNGEVTGSNGEVTTIGPDGEATTGSGGGQGGDGSVGSGEGGSSQGGLALAVNDGLGNVARGRLPSTGGGWAVLLIAGAVLIGGGVLLVRRFASSA